MPHLPCTTSAGFLLDSQRLQNMKAGQPPEFIQVVGEQHKKTPILQVKQKEKKKKQ